MRKVPATCRASVECGHSRRQELAAAASPPHVARRFSSWLCADAPAFLCTSVDENGAAAPTTIRLAHHGRSAMCALNTARAHSSDARRRHAPRVHLSARWLSARSHRRTSAPIISAAAACLSAAESVGVMARAHCARVSSIILPVAAPGAHASPDTVRPRRASTLDDQRETRARRSDDGADSETGGRAPAAWARGQAHWGGTEGSRRCSGEGVMLLLSPGGPHPAVCRVLQQPCTHGGAAAGCCRHG